jgi:hypothetical protein
MPVYRMLSAHTVPVCVISSYVCVSNSASATHLWLAATAAVPSF